MIAYICDRCGKHSSDKNLYQITFKTSNMGRNQTLQPYLSKKEICDDCLKEIFKYVDDFSVKELAHDHTTS